MLAPSATAPGAVVTPILGGSVLVLGVPFQDAYRAEGACLEALGSLRSPAGRLRMLAAIVELRGLQGRAS
jgi:hypothetical protein